MTFVPSPCIGWKLNPSVMRGMVFSFYEKLESWLALFWSCEDRIRNQEVGHNQTMQAASLILDFSASGTGRNNIHCLKVQHLKLRHRCSPSQRQTGIPLGLQMASDIANRAHVSNSGPTHTLDLVGISQSIFHHQQAIQHPGTEVRE